MSDTPLTDAVLIPGDVIKHGDPACVGGYYAEMPATVPAEFARDLERQLAEAKELIKELAEDEEEAMRAAGEWDLSDSYCTESVATVILRMKAEIERMRPVVEAYNELIYAVASKFPDETRHQTALRYIINAESGATGQGCEASKKD